MLINGKPETSVSADDRGIQYGDGLFETLAVRDGRPCLWHYHLERLHNGCQRLNIPLPNESLLYDELIREIGEQSQGVVKVIVTRGPGGRGYRPPQESSATRIIRWSESPNYPEANYQQGIVTRLCSTRLGWNPALAGIKHLNRLEQVLARSEWSDPSIQEGLMMDSSGYVVEGTMSNLFVVQNGRLMTPDLSRCGVAGIMQGVVLRVAEALAIPVIVDNVTLHDLWNADALFVTNSLIGLWPVRELSGQAFDVSVIPRELISRVMLQAYAHALS
ncbi:MAG: aminodeoxychorismate lyase [Sedimenticola sp.]|nr:aminodeoxychorismate lyase [Sedimenticola sp.]